MEARNPAEIEEKLNYHFKNRELLFESLRHSSYVNEQGVSGLRDNERLEFLGDAVLNLVVGDLLMERYPDLKEGELSRMRASLVCESQLAQIARRLDLGAYVRLGRGEARTRGREKDSILADTLEALLAAVYRDGGLENARRMIREMFAPLLEQLPSAAAQQDFKSRLQEMVQERHRAMPEYRVIAESGPDHDKTFTVSLKVLGIRVQGSGKNKKAAEQEAARNALKTLEKDNFPR